MAPDFLLDYLDLIEMTIQSARLADSTGIVRLLNVVNSLERPVCQQVMRRWDELSAGLPDGVCLYTVSMDLPLAQARCKLPKESCTRCSPRSGARSSDGTTECCGSEWYLLQRAAFVIDRNDYIVYAEYIADQMGEPDYAAAIEVSRQGSPMAGA